MSEAQCRSGLTSHPWSVSALEPALRLVDGSQVMTMRPNLKCRKCGWVHESFGPCPTPEPDGPPVTCGPPHQDLVLQEIRRRIAEWCEVADARDGAQFIADLGDYIDAEAPYVRHRLGLP